MKLTNDINYYLDKPIERFIEDLILHKRKGYGTNNKLKEIGYTLLKERTNYYERDSRFLEKK